jgi:hypothetical protein
MGGVGQLLLGDRRALLADGAFARLDSDG